MACWFAPASTDTVVWACAAVAPASVVASAAASARARSLNRMRLLGSNRGGAIVADGDSLARAQDLPAGVGDGGQHDAARDRCAVHLPEHVVSGGLVAPQDVRPPV